MKQILLPLLFLFCSVYSYGQGAGFGYQMDLGAKNKFNVGEGYNQEMKSLQHSFFVRWHTHQGRKGHQIVTGLRIDSIGFKNNTSFLSDDLKSFEHYNVDAHLKRIAWRFGYLTQRQFIGEPGKFVVAFNYGLAYEFTSQMKRKSEYDNIEYKLYSEQNRHNLIGTLGIEARFWYVTVGLKYEHMFFDMINHNYIKTLELNTNNSSELHGLKLSPSMAFFYLAFHFDFFNSNPE